MSDGGINPAAQISLSKQAKPRGTITKIACSECQKRKCKCYGERPTCSNCNSRKARCVYEYNDRISRHANLKRKNINLTAENNDLQLLFDMLRTGTDEDSSAIYARVRLGEPIEEVVTSVKNGEPPAQRLDTSIEHLTIAECERLQSTYLLPFFDRKQLASNTKSSGDTIAVALADPNSFESSINLNNSTDFPDAFRPRRDTVIDEMERFVEEKRKSLLEKEKGKPQRYIRLASNLDEVLGSNPFLVPPRANSFPDCIQSRQVGSICMPAWAIVTMSDFEDDPLSRSIGEGISEMKSMLANGISSETLFGTTPDVAALLSQDAYTQAPYLSQFAARMTRSVRDPDVTQLASMFLFWHLLRWLIDPNPDTYDAIPDWYRPTPDQCFVPHPFHNDFLVWPKLRSEIVRRPELWSDTEWLLVFASTIDCGWRGGLDGFLEPDGCGGTMVTSYASQHIRNIDNWSVGAAFRPYLVNADNFVRIRI